jgi:hypothetical protein
VLRRPPADENGRRRGGVTPPGFPIRRNEGVVPAPLPVAIKKDCQILNLCYNELRSIELPASYLCPYFYFTSCLHPLFYNLMHLEVS